MSALLRIDAIDFAALCQQQLAPVAVAVVDSGVDATHPDLRNRVGSAWCAGRNAEQQMRAQRVEGLRNQDEYGHGTAVAGIIAALAPNATIHDYKIFAAGETSSGEGMLASLEAALASGARLINMSLATKGALKAPLLLMMEQAYRQGTLVVAAQRNIPTSDYGVPAELAHCIGVGIHEDSAPYLLRFRPSHPIAFAGRGQHVLAPATGGGYTEVTGTSFATPTVASMCALLLGADPQLEAYEIKTLLKAHAAYCLTAAG